MRGGASRRKFCVFASKISVVGPCALNIRGECTMEECAGTSPQMVLHHTRRGPTNCPQRSLSILSPCSNRTRCSAPLQSAVHHFAVLHLQLRPTYGHPCHAPCSVPPPRATSAYQKRPHRMPKLRHRPTPVRHLGPFQRSADELQCNLHRESRRRPVSQSPAAATSRSPPELRDYIEGGDFGPGRVHADARRYAIGSLRIDRFDLSGHNADIRRYATDSSDDAPATGFFTATKWMHQLARAYVIPVIHTRLLREWFACRPPQCRPIRRGISLSRASSARSPTHATALSVRTPRRPRCRRLRRWTPT